MPETTSSQAAPVAASVEPPTSSAKLVVSLRPDDIGGTAEATVPAGQAHHLITTFTMVGGLGVGVGGAALTLYIDRTLIAAALAELVLALITILLIAVISRGTSRPGMSNAGGGSAPGKPASPAGR